MMAGIKGKNTQPELIIRRSLFRKGFRYKLHDKNLPGKPDLVFHKFNSVVFIHGCFWHGHNCHLFKWPSTRPDFWRKKIYGNREVDKRNYRQLKKGQWYILTIWECAIKGKKKKPLNKIIASITKWIETGKRDKTIKG